MYDAYKHPSEDEPRFRLNALKRGKPGIRDILIAAADADTVFTVTPKEIVKADSIPGDTWYTK